MKATLNTASVMAKLKEWEKSNAGKEKIKETINRLIDNDIRQTEAGSRVLTVAWVTELAIELGDMIIANSPTQIDFDVSVDAASRTDSGGIEATISITGNLKRPSLWSDVFDGVENIVVLFEKGYSARATVWGYWNGDFTWSLQSREGLGFVQGAVESFNGRYEALGITAILQGAYA